MNCLSLLHQITDSVYEAFDITGPKANYLVLCEALRSCFKNKRLSFIVKEGDFIFGNSVLLRIKQGDYADNLRGKLFLDSCNMCIFVDNGKERPGISYQRKEQLVEKRK